MKKITNIKVLMATMLAIASVAFLSCGGSDDDDDEPTPVATFTVEPAEVVLQSSNGASGSFVITTDNAWSITQAPNFVQVYPTSGQGSATVRVTTTRSNDSNQPLEGAITVESGGATQTIRVVQQGFDDCYVEPINVLRLSDGLAFNWEFSSNVKYYYWGFFTQAEYNTMSEAEVINSIVTNNTDDRRTPDNDDFACVYNATASTSYVIVTVAFAEGDRQGQVVVTPLTTKSFSNQPLASIEDVSYYTNTNGDRYYGWTVSKNNYCSRYYTYAAASPASIGYDIDSFYSYYLLASGYTPMLAWLIKQEIQKDGEDHTTSINEQHDYGFYFSSNGGRDQFFGAQVGTDSPSYLRALYGSDKYFLVLTWGEGSDGELSGRFEYWGTGSLLDTSSNAKSKSLKPLFVPKARATGRAMKADANISDFKLSRID